MYKERLIDTLDKLHERVIKIDKLVSEATKEELELLFPMREITLLRDDIQYAIHRMTSELLTLIDKADKKLDQLEQKINLLNDILNKKLQEKDSAN